MIYVMEGQGALVNEKGEETALKAGDFALVDPSEKHQYHNKGDQPFKMICGVPKVFIIQTKDPPTCKGSERIILVQKKNS